MSFKNTVLLAGIFARMMLLFFYVVAARNHSVSPVTALNFDWNPNDPPLWTIRPEDREAFLENRTAFLERRDGDPCGNRDRPARLYHQYFAEDCKPPRRLQADGTCEKYDQLDENRPSTDCSSYCQIRTYFEWSEERPFPASECHYPIKCGMTETDSTTWSYRGGLTGKLQFLKAVKVGITGSYSWGASTAHGRSWSVSMLEGQCGYFTFIPVRKITCGTMSVGQFRADRGRYWCSGKPEDGAYHMSNFCVDQMWNVNDPIKKQQVPDGVIIFVWTDCLTREPLPMDKQDPAYRAPGVALDTKTIQSIQQGWVWNTCYLVDMGEPGKKRLFIRGPGFRDDKIGVKGEKLAKAVNACTGGKAADGAFDWYYNGYADDSPKEQGAVWLLKATVPANTRPGCFGEFLMLMGGVTMDRCT